METQTQFSDFDKAQIPPNNNMTLSVIGTVIGLCSPCCVGLIFGIIAIVKSSQVNSFFSSGNFLGAENAAKSAKTLAYIAIILGILGIIFSVVSIMAMGGISNYSNEIEEILRNIEK